MVPESGKSPDAPKKRCKVLVFEMCSSIKSPLLRVKIRKGLPGMDKPLLRFWCRCFPPAQSLGQGEGYGMLFSCGFWWGCLGDVVLGVGLMLRSTERSIDKGGGINIPYR
jgi:hypothetical protein